MFKKLGLIIIILSTAALYQCAQETTEAVPEEMKSDLAYLPDSGAGLVYLNFEEIRESAFFNRFIDEELQDNIQDKRYRKFVETTGFDFRKDLSEIYITFLAEEPIDENNAFVVMKGRFDQEKIVAFMKENQLEKEFTQTTFAERTLYTSRDDDVCFTFVTDNLVFAGNLPGVKKALNRFDKKDTQDAADYYTSLIEPVRYKGEGFFTMRTTPVLNKLGEDWKNTDATPVFSSLKTVQKVNVSFKFSENLYFNGYGSFEDKQKAELFHEAVKGGIAAVKLSVSEDRSMVDILNKIKVEQEGSAVRLHFEMSQDEIQKILNEEYRIAGLDIQM